jgi:G3E family GTPase
MMDVLLISGFLGAGKTTLLRHLLGSWDAGLGRAALIVNEIGEIGIDGALLSGQNVEMIELVNGCICCSIRTDFARAMLEIGERVQPNIVLVEATGVAQPGDLLEVLLEPPVAETVRVRGMVTVVDAGFFKARDLLGSFYENQIRLADILVLNKIDEVETPALLAIRTAVQAMNPQAFILPALHGNVHPSLIFSGSRGTSAVPSERDRSVGNPGFETMTVEGVGTLDREQFRRFLDGLPGNVFRCKGWVRFQDGASHVDFTGGRHRIEPIEEDRGTALVFIGRDLDRQGIEEALKKCLDPAHGDR